MGGEIWAAHSLTVVYDGVSQRVIETLSIICKGGDFRMSKKSRGGRMTAAKRRAKKTPGGNGLVKNRPAGRNIMNTYKDRVIANAPPMTGEGVRLHEGGAL